LAQADCRVVVGEMFAIVLEMLLAFLVDSDYKVCLASRNDMIPPPCEFDLLRRTLE